MKIKPMHQDVYISVVLYLVSIFFLIQSLKLPSDSAMFPILAIVAFAILNTIVLFDGIKKTKAMWNEEPGSINTINCNIIKKPLVVFVLTVIYAILFKYTNFFIATTIYMIALMKFYKIKSWLNIISITTAFNIVIYIGFVKMLHVPLI